MLILLCGCDVVTSRKNATRPVMVLFFSCSDGSRALMREGDVDEEVGHYFGKEVRNKNMIRGFFSWSIPIVF